MLGLYCNRVTLCCKIGEILGHVVLASGVLVDLEKFEAEMSL